MRSEIEDLNDWRPASHELRLCSLRTFCHRIAALQHRADEAGTSTRPFWTQPPNGPEMRDGVLEDGSGTPFKVGRRTP